MNVKVVVLKNGISILGEVNEQMGLRSRHIRIKNPVEISLGSIKDDAASVTFFPFLHYAVESYQDGIPIDIDGNIMCILTPNDELKNHYISAFNGSKEVIDTNE